MRSLRVVVSLALLAVPVGAALAQSARTPYPDRPLRYIVPFPPGGSTDIVARIIAAALTDELGRQVVIDNRAGAGSTVGAEIAGHAAPFAGGREVLGVHPVRAGQVREGRESRGHQPAVSVRRA